MIEPKHVRKREILNATLRKAPLTGFGKDLMILIKKAKGKGKKRLLGVASSLISRGRVRRKIGNGKWNGGNGGVLRRGETMEKRVINGL